MRKRVQGGEKRRSLDLSSMGLGAGVQAAVKGTMLTERLPDIKDMPVLNFTGS